MNDAADPFEPMRGPRIFRALLVALTATLAIVLIVRGSVVVGVLLLAIAATRVALLVQVQRRRKQFRARIASRRR